MDRLNSFNAYKNNYAQAMSVIVRNTFILE